MVWGVGLHWQNYYHIKILFCVSGEDRGQRLGDRPILGPFKMYFTSKLIWERKEVRKTLFLYRILIFPPGHLFFCTLNMAPFTQSEAKRASWQKEMINKKDGSWQPKPTLGFGRPRPHPQLPGSQRPLPGGGCAAKERRPPLSFAGLQRFLLTPAPGFLLPRPAPAAGASASACRPAPGVRRSSCTGRRCPPTHTSNALFSPEKFLDYRDYFLLM